MTLNTIPFLIIIIVLNSCDKKISGKISEINRSTDSLTHISEKLDFTITQPKIENRKIPKSWESLNAIQKDWIEVKKDEKGYLIYVPCEGNTQRITLKNGYLYIQWQKEPEYKFHIDKFTILSDDQSFRLDAYEEITQTGFPVSAKIIDAEKGLVLWEFRNEMEKEKWVMTPFENAENFRKIKNNCPDYKRGELQFIEIP